MLGDQRTAAELCRYFIRLIFGLNVSLCGDFQRVRIVCSYSLFSSVFQSYEKFFEIS